MIRVSNYLTFLFENNIMFPYASINLLGIDFGSEIIVKTLNDLSNK